jgi:hypothetical protein
VPSSSPAQSSVEPPCARHQQGSDLISVELLDSRSWMLFPSCRDFWQVLSQLCLLSVRIPPLFIPLSRTPYSPHQTASRFVCLLLLYLFCCHIRLLLFFVLIAAANPPCCSSPRHFPFLKKRLRCHMLVAHFTPPHTRHSTENTH